MISFRSGSTALVLRQLLLASLISWCLCVRLSTTCNRNHAVCCMSPSRLVRNWFTGISYTVSNMRRVAVAFLGREERHACENGRILGFTTVWTVYAPPVKRLFYRFPHIAYWKWTRHSRLPHPAWKGLSNMYAFNNTVSSWGPDWIPLWAVFGLQVVRLVPVLDAD